MRLPFRRPNRRTLGLYLGLAVLCLVAAIVGFARTVSQLRAQRATGPNWSFPSRVFSDGVLLVAGRTVSPEYLESELAAREYREVRGAPTAPGTWARGVDGWTIVLRGFPDEGDPLGSGGPERVFVALDQGHIRVVRRLGGVPGSTPPDVAHPPRLEPVLVSMLFDEERMWRTYVSLERVPEPVRNAIVSSEDRRFFSHPGIDPRGAIRALTVNLRQHDVRQGGSTITQQLARGLFLGRERTLLRKLTEVPFAMGLEILLSKEQILEMYLNSVYWGQAEGFSVGGIAEAARWYFDAPVESLTVLQGATLAAMIPAPNLYNPFKDPETVRERRNAVLQEMVQTKSLAEGEAARLAIEPLGVHRGRTPVERFPSYSGYVRDVLDDQLSHHAATHFGLSVYTAMDLAWQQTAEEAVRSGLELLGRAQLQGAFVALEPTRGAVLAMVGGRDPNSGDFNRAYQARRQTGSAIKPIVYAAAFAGGMSPATTVPDTQRTWGRGRSAWRPQNFDGAYHPEVTLARALESSLNLATTEVVERVGPYQVADAAANFGLGKLKPVMSIGLGSNEVSLLQLTSAFEVFASKGQWRKASPLRVAVDRSGKTVAMPPEETSDAISPGVAALMTGLLQNVTRYGVARALHGTYGFDRPVAGKTGTTNDYHDAWFVGFTPDIVAGAWVGYDRPRSIGDQAAHTALPLWARAVGRMLRGFPPAKFTTDTELDWVNINPWKGCVAESSAYAETTPFLFGTAPTMTCESWMLYDLPPDPSDTSFTADSAFASDSLWHEERRPLLPDTTRVPEPEPEPEPEPDTTESPTPRSD